MNASPNNPLFVDKAQMEMYLKSNDYFTLYQCLFPTLSQAGANNKAVKKNDPTSRDIATYKNDISIKQLLETASPFKLERLFFRENSTGESSDQLTSWYERNQPTERRMKDSLEDEIELYYLLCAGRPFHAFKIVSITRGIYQVTQVRKKFKSFFYLFLGFWSSERKWDLCGYYKRITL